MSTLTLVNTTAQVRPWPAGGAWNNVVHTARVAGKSTNFGTTLAAAALISAWSGIGSWLAPGTAGTAMQRAQKLMRALGVEIAEAAALATAQAGNGVTANVVDRGSSLGAATVVVTTTVGATPTCTYQLEGSMDGTTWSPQSWADSGTPTSFGTGTFVLTTATTKTLIVNPTVAWRFLRITFSANTNVTNTVTAYVSG